MAENKNNERNVVIPVAQMIPGINLEGLVQKEDLINGNEEAQWDFNPQRVPNTYGNGFPSCCAEAVYDFFCGLSYTQIDEWRHLRGQIVVDLGAGKNSYGYLIADLANAEGYMGVEPNHAHCLKDPTNAPFRPNLQHTLNGTPASVVQENMRDFIKRLPDNSVSFTCFGIDDDILPSEDYRKETRKEIARALSPKGAYINDFSSHLTLDGGEMEGGNIEKDDYASYPTYIKKQG